MLEFQEEEDRRGDEQNDADELNREHSERDERAHERHGSQDSRDTDTGMQKLDDDESEPEVEEDEGEIRAEDRVQDGCSEAEVSFLDRCSDYVEGGRPVDQFDRPPFHV